MWTNRYGAEASLRSPELGRAEAERLIARWEARQAEKRRTEGLYERSAWMRRLLGR